MWGLEINSVRSIIQQLPDAAHLTRFSDWVIDPPIAPTLTPVEQRELDMKRARLVRLPAGVRPVTYPVHTGRCHVCDLEEEAEGYNELLVCDNPHCRVMVHQNCYGVARPPKSDEVWLCDPCRLGVSPICELCPVLGGALKPTDTGRWCHLTCALWMPGTDVQSDETGLAGPISGINRVDPERRPLKCSICMNPGNLHGACIQCNGDWNCYKSFHVLCARNAGLLMEQIEAKHHVIPGAPASALKKKKNKVDGTDFGNGLILKCYCNAHRGAAVTKSWNRSPTGVPSLHEARRLGSPHSTPAKPVTNSKKKKQDQPGQAKRPLLEPEMQEEGYQPRVFEDGNCSRTAVVNLNARRGMKAPDAVAAAMEKRKFVRGLSYVPTLYGGKHADLPMPDSTCTLISEDSELNGNAPSTGEPSSSALRTAT